MFPFRVALMVSIALLVPPALATAQGNALQPVPNPRPAPVRPPNGAALPPAQFDPSLDVGGVGVDARQIRTRLSVAVTINGRGPYQFIVDSGADSSAVGTNIAKQLELPLGTPVTLNGMTSRTLVDRIRVATLGLGPTTIRDLHLPVLREVDMGGQGIIGIDALHQQRLMMDFDKHFIKVEDARTRVRSLPGEIVIVGRRRRGQLILTEVRAANQRLDAIIDTGSEVTIGNLALRDKLLRKHRATLRPIELIGVTGEKITVELAIISELELGPVTIRDVPIAFADLPPFKLFGLGDQPALLLGTDILESFRRVSLDFRSRKVRFQLRRCSSQGVLISTAPENISRLSATRDSNSCSR